MQDDLIIQKAQAASAVAPELLLLFHGVGSNEQDLSPLGHALAECRPQAWIISVRAPHPSEFGSGWQWFSVQGITERERPARVAAATPSFIALVQAWQEATGISASHTTLLGFSQRAIMALESTQAESAAPAARVVAIAGRFAQPPRHAPSTTVFNLLHGDQDGVMPVELALDADRQLRALGARTTLDRFASLGHGIDARVVRAIARRLEEGRPDISFR